MGGLGVEEIYGLESLIPDNVALGTEECLKRCGITRGDQPNAQRQPRVAANAYYDGIVAAPLPTPTFINTAPSESTAAPEASGEPTGEGEAPAEEGEAPAEEEAPAEAEGEGEAPAETEAPAEESGEEAATSTEGGEGEAESE